VDDRGGRAVAVVKIRRRREEKREVDVH